MTEYSPGQFLKCPECHRKTVKISIHIDGDFSIQCKACNAGAIGHKLHESDRVYQ
jgi:hypothetical protein